MAFVYFVLLLGGLVFFHEFGHFLLARSMGVHVTTFSIGFGPPLLKFRGRRKYATVPPTEYVVALLPLGGFVKMLGDEPGEELPPEQEAVAFQSKPVWRRVLIVAAGPVFNLILPYLIFFAVGLFTAQETPSHIGMVAGGRPAAEAGMEPGDRIVAIEGEPVRYWWQVQKRISEHPDERLSVRVDRPGRDEPVTLELRPRAVTKPLVPGLDVHETVGRIGVAPMEPTSRVAVLEESPAYRAGLRHGMRITAVEDQPVKTLRALRDALAEHADSSVEVRWEDVTRSSDARRVSKLVGMEEGRTTLPPADEDPLRGFAAFGCLIRKIHDGSPAADMGLEAGDVVMSFDGHPCRHWGFVRSRLQEAPEAEHSLTWARDGEIYRKRRAEWLAEITKPAPTDRDRKVESFGVEPAPGTFEHPDPVANEHRLSYAFTRSIDRTNEAIRLNVAALVGLFTGNVPFKELSGPIGIAQLASRTSEHGWDYFFGLMVWLSISLGLINLLPVPVLDGGHLLFLSIEGIRRRPVSLRTRQIATYIGLAFIVLLMILVIRNDLQRPWG